MMMNIHTHEWDPDLLEIIGVSRDALPTIHSCSEIYGKGVGVLEGVILGGKEYLYELIYRFFR